MKKFLLTGLAVLFIGLSANAETIVHYNAGMPVSMTTTGPGYMNTVPVVKGNAVSTVRPYARTYGGMHPRGGIRPLPPMSHRTNRALANGYYNNYYNQPTVVTRTTTETSKPMSRLNKNYVRPQRSSYTVGGITYYN